jgi:hypothetical protein
MQQAYVEAGVHWSCCMVDWCTMEPVYDGVCVCWSQHIIMPVMKPAYDGACVEWSERTVRWSQHMTDLVYEGTDVCCCRYTVL